MHDHTGMYGSLIKAVLLISILFEQMNINYCLLSINNMTHQKNTKYLRYSVVGILIFCQVSFNDKKKSINQELPNDKKFIICRTNLWISEFFIRKTSYVLFCFFIFFNVKSFMTNIYDKLRYNIIWLLLFILSTFLWDPIVYWK